jgi:hypothetical protein
MKMRMVTPAYPLRAGAVSPNLGAGEFAPPIRPGIQAQH